MPQLSHDALGSSIRKCITVLLWYVAIMKDGVNLKVLEAGTVNNLIMAYCNMVTPPCTSSGHANQYDFISFKFPVSMKMETESVIRNIILS